MTITASAAEAPVVVDATVTYRRLQDVTSSYEVTATPAFFASLERKGDHWVVVDHVTGIHGYGSEASEAIGDFAHALREHLDVLERQEALSIDLARQLEYLRSRLGQ